MCCAPTKTQISLDISPVWSESSLSAWRNIGYTTTHWVHCQDFDQTGRMPRLIWVFAGRTDHFVCFVMRWLIFCISKFTVVYLLLEIKIRNMWFFLCKLYMYKCFARLLNLGTIKFKLYVKIKFSWIIVNVTVMYCTFFSCPFVFMLHLKFHMIYITVYTDEFLDILQQKLTK